MRVIVIGAGEVGYHIASKLTREKAEVVLVDIDQARLDLAAENLDVQTVQGSGADPATLVSAGLREADLLVAVTASDEANLLACRLAQLLAPPEVRRLARVRASSFYEFFDEKRLRSDFGLNFTINPSLEAVQAIMDFIEYPGVSDVIDVARGRLKLVGLRLRPRHHLLGRPLAELLPRGQGAADLLIAAIYRRHDLVIPRGDTVLKADDLVYVAAGADDAGKLADFFRLDPQPIRQVVIAGGGEVGLALARRLETDERNFSVKLIENSPERSEYLSERLTRTMVLRGDGSDQDLLKEENAGACDAFIAVSTNDESNLISCLVAKRLGARHTITRVNRSSYAPLVSAIGLEAMISARVAAASAVLKYIRKGRVISVATLANEEAEIIEFQVLGKSRAAGRRLRELKIPPGALIIALTRGEEIIIPHGAAAIEAGDVVAVVAKAEAIPALEKLLSK